MNGILDNPTFRATYERMEQITLNPARHTAPTARAHSEAVADLALRLGQSNGCSDEQLALLVDLGHAHDIGKVTGSARPEHSLELLRECQPDLDPGFLSLVKWHDVGLPWFVAKERGQPPSEKAWRRLAREVDLRLLCIFMVADRVDSPGGWRRNAPTTWFLGEARRRNLVGDLELDLPDHPSLVSAGGALVRAAADGTGDELLLIRVRAEGFELPKGGIEWDETPEAAACREVSEEAGVSGTLEAGRHLGDLDYLVDQEGRPVLKRVRYYLPNASGLEMVARPERTRERIWIGSRQVAQIALVNPDLRPLLTAALEQRP